MPIWGKSEHEIKLESKVRFLEDDAKNLKAQIAQQEREIKGLRSDKKNLQDTEAKSKSKNSDLKNDIKLRDVQLKDRNQDICDLQKINDSLRMEVEEEQKKFLALLNQDRTERNKMEQITAKLAELETMKNRVEAENKYLKARIKDLEEDAEMHKSNIDEKVSDITELSIKYSVSEQKVQSLESEKRQLETWQKEKERRMDELKMEKERMDQEKTAYQTELAHLRETKVKLEAAVTELGKREQDLRNQTATLHKDMDARVKEIREKEDLDRKCMAEETREALKQQGDTFYRSFSKATNHHEKVIATLLDAQKEAHKEALDVSKEMMNRMFDEQKSQKQFSLKSLQVSLQNTESRMAIGPKEDDDDVSAQ